MTRLSVAVAALPVSLALATAALVLGLPATAAARERHVLVALKDRIPTQTAFADRVVEGGATAHAAQSGGGTRVYTTPSGTRIPITIDSGLAGDDSKAQTYANFLDRLPHGSELARLRVLLVAGDDVGPRCGATDQEVLACYLPASRTMIVPGDRDEAGGVTTSFVIAHEYGHHIAAHRANPPFGALDYGPKRWASYERVCSRTLDGTLFPGDEGDHYVRNPGEAWAESYAHLVPEYRYVEWDFTRLLTPTSASLTAARSDVERPWTGARTRTFRGSFAAGGASVRRLRLRLALDGALRVRLSGPSDANYDLRLSAGGHRFARSRARGSQDGVRAGAACRTRPGAETVTVSVLRRSGSGPFRVRATYAG